jgi:RHS repeat-associated protein
VQVRVVTQGGLMVRLSSLPHSAVRCLILVFAYLSVQLAGIDCAAAADSSPSPGTISSLALRTAGIFEEPLVATGQTSGKEDLALSIAIEQYKAQEIPDDFTVFHRFLTQFPKSNWRAALLTNLGLQYYHYGYFSRAIECWEGAWSAGRDASSGPAKALVDRAVGELVRMHARLGHADRLDALFSEVGNRAVSGPATEALTGAKEGLWTMRNDPGIAYLCGPMALKNLLLFQKATSEQLRFLDEYRSGPDGVSLAQVADLADQAKLSFTLVFRSKNVIFPVPAIVHLKVSHFAALVGESNGRFHLKDPTFGTDLWLTRHALESETSGYFLVPSKTILPGFREVGVAEARNIRGMGFTTDNDPNATMPSDEKSMDDQNCGGSCQPPCQGMCGYNVTEMVVSLNLRDTPVGYTPPKGPPVPITITYNQREAGQPANFSFFNVSPKWTFNWLTYIQDDPTFPGSNVTRYVAGGGFFNHLGYDSSTGYFYPENGTKAGAFFQRASANSYIRFLPDGTVETYAQSDGATNYPRRIFLTQIADPTGNKVVLNYDGQLRLISITDATGRNTTFSYELASNPLLVTRITDPFGRGASLTYDGGGRLSQIKDVIGFTSNFTYDNSNLVNSMTTPYGTTTFVFGSGVAIGPYRFIEITDPLGKSERVEYLQGAPGIPSEDSPVPDGILAFDYQGSMYMNGRDTFYWDKHALAMARGDYTKARNRHWLHDGLTGATSNVLESVKYPLERRVWSNYPGQTSPGGAGATGFMDKPRIIARVLDDGTTQSTLILRNAHEKVTSVADPVGRVTFYDYDTNGVDVVAIKQQTSPGVFSTIANFTYNPQHLPLTYTNAAGQTTKYSYSGGQLIQSINALGESTRYIYDGQGYLTTIINANNQVANTFTYDGLGRVATMTDSAGYTLTYAYDALDRITKVTYPDGTTRAYTWNKLDLVSFKDRQGRMTIYTYDAVRNLIDITDPLDRHTKFTYYENGHLKTVTDANGNTTNWNIDIQNRTTANIYPDGSQRINTFEATTSRIKSVTDPLGQVKQYAYALDNQLSGISYLNALNATPNVTFAYDLFFPRLVSMTDGSGTTEYQYGSLGASGALKLLKELGSDPSASIAYDYDALGRIISRSVDTSKETFSYDNLGRLAVHSDALGTFTVGYLGQLQQPVSRTLGAGPVKTQWIYDTNTNDRRLRFIQNGAAPRNYQLTTTPENITTQLNETGGGMFRPWIYSYDAADRLLQASSGGAQFLYNYDSADNITHIQNLGGSQNALYNNLNQVVSFNNNSFFYDTNGNLIADGVRTYQWDAENRLLSVTLKNQPTINARFRYDGFGRRIAIVSSGAAGSTEMHYLWCGDVLCQGRDSNGVVTRRYFPEGELSYGTQFYYAQDHLGSVRDVLNGQTGYAVASFDYDPYGNPTRTSGNASPDFRYAGMFYEENTGLYLTQYRVYDPSSGRWLNPDRFVGMKAFNRGPGKLSTGTWLSSTNLYEYSLNSPSNFKDPNGQFAIPAAITAVGLYILTTCSLHPEECGAIAESVVSLLTRENTGQLPSTETGAILKLLETVKDSEATKWAVQEGVVGARSSCIPVPNHFFPLQLAQVGLITNLISKLLYSIPMTGHIDLLKLSRESLRSHQSVGGSY